MIEVTFAKNGPGVVFHVWEVDHSQLECRLEGDYYQFNHQLKSTHVYTHKTLAELLWKSSSSS